MEENLIKWQACQWEGCDRTRTPYHTPKRRRGVRSTRRIVFSTCTTWRNSFSDVE